MGKVTVTTCGTLAFFFCPGCDTYHAYTIKGDRKWKFNGDVDKPTFSPSLMIIPHEGIKRCHLYVREGKIQFLKDCEHKLAGTTVIMEEDDRCPYS